MSIVKQLILKPEFKLIGFIGGRGRNHFVDALASGLLRENKNVIISHLGTEKVPGSGYLVQDSDDHELISKIDLSLKNNKLIYAGKSQNQGFVKGITRQTIKKLIENPRIDVILLFLGTAVEYNFLSKKTINEISNIAFLDQLIYCLQIDKIDRELDESSFEIHSEFIDNFPKFKSFKNYTHQLFLDYLTDPVQGSCRLFQQKWPSLLLFTDINNILLENKAINLARELYLHQIRHIFYTNIKENLVKRILLE